MRKITIGIIVLVALHLHPLLGQSLRVISPNGGEILKLNTTTPIKWIADHVKGKIVIVLYKKGIKFRTISPGAPNTGLFQWQIPQHLPPGREYRIRVRSEENLSINDFSDRNFQLIAPRQDS